MRASEALGFRPRRDDSHYDSDPVALTGRASAPPASAQRSVSCGGGADASVGRGVGNAVICIHIYIIYIYITYIKHG